MTLIMAESRINAYLKADQECKEGDLLPFDKEKKQCPWRIVDRMKGTELEGMRYEQLMPWVKPCEKVDDFAPKFVTNKCTASAAHPEGILTPEGQPEIYSELYYGVILSATSVSITVATLKELKKLDTPVGTALVSAAILDDVIAFIGFQFREFIDSGEDAWTQFNIFAIIVADDACLDVLATCIWTGVHVRYKSDGRCLFLGIAFQCSVDVTHIVHLYIAKPLLFQFVF